MLWCLNRAGRTVIKKISAVFKKLILFLLLIFSISLPAFSGNYGDIVFEDKQFFADDYAIHIAGTIIGNGIWGQNNTVTIICSKSDKKCDFAVIEQIGPNQLGAIEIFSYEIIKFESKIVIATDDVEFVSCQKTTIKIDIVNKTVSGLIEPTKKTSPFCKTTDPKIYTWTVEDNPNWKKIMGR